MCMRIRKGISYEATVQTNVERKKYEYIKEAFCVIYCIDEDKERAQSLPFILLTFLASEFYM